MMPEALIGLILSWGFLTMVVAILYPIDHTSRSVNVVGMALLPVIASLIWLVVEVVY